MGIVYTICPRIKDLLSYLNLTFFSEKNYKQKLIEKNRILSLDYHFQESKELENLKYSRIDIPFMVLTPKTKSLEIKSLNTKNFEEEILPNDSLESLQYISNFEKDHENNISPIHVNNKLRYISPIKINGYKENNIELINIEENNSEDYSKTNSTYSNNESIINNTTKNIKTNLFSKKIKSYENLFRTKVFK
jgi:hypothetical protein